MAALLGVATTGSLCALPLTHLVPKARDVARGEFKLPVPDVPMVNPWHVLEPYQETITAADFEALLEVIYDPFDGTEGMIEITDEAAIFYPEPGVEDIPQYVLRFAPEGTEAWERTPRDFRLPEEFRAIPKVPGKPLQGLRVAIDPGHIGGEWARMEGRSAKYRGREQRVQEGDHVLLAAQILKRRLENLGAEVFMVREDATPVTDLRPEDLVEAARDIMLRKTNLESAKEAIRKADGVNPKTSLDHKLRRLSEVLFYRAEEITARARKINAEFEPDVSLAMHFNATGGSGRGQLTSRNRHVFFVHGAYTKEEAASIEQRQRMIEKLVEGSLPVEIEVADAVGRAFEERTGDPPVLYGNSKNTRRILKHNLFVVARNLAANRMIDGPVVFLEPYFMNQRETVDRLLAGDYEGKREFGTGSRAKEFPSIYQEYAGAVVDGLLEVYGPPRDPRLELVADHREGGPSVETDPDAANGSAEQAPEENDEPQDLDDATPDGPNAEA